MDIKLLKPNQLLEEIRRSLNFLEREYSYLFDSDVHEISIVHQFACLLKKSDLLKGYSIDLEYNRITNFSDGTQKKILSGGKESFFRTDLVVHIPKTQLGNLLALEFSKGTNNADEEKKLIELTKRSGKYKYRIGILIDLPKYSSWKYFVDGEIFNNKEDSLKKLIELEDESLILFDFFSKININYQIAKESDVEVGTNEARTSVVFNYQIFPESFKRYFQTAFVPNYFKCYEIVSNLHEITLVDVMKDNLIFFPSDDWFLNSNLAFPAISNLCQYCHFSLTNNISNKKEILNKLNILFYENNFSEKDLDI